MKWQIKGKYEYTYEIRETSYLHLDEFVEADTKEEAIEEAIRRNEDKMESGEYVDQDTTKLHAIPLDDNYEEPEHLRLLRLGPAIAPSLFSALL